MKANNAINVNKIDLPKEAVTEFAEIYRRHCKKRLSFSKAQTEASNLLSLYKLIAKV